MQDIETKLAKALIERLLGAGLLLSVHDGEEVTVKRSTDADAIFAALETTEMDNLVCYEADNKLRIGAVLLIWGNGEDLISDHTDCRRLNDLLDGWVMEEAS